MRLDFMELVSQRTRERADARNLPCRAYRGARPDANPEAQVLPLTLQLASRSVLSCASFWRAFFVPACQMNRWHQAEVE